MRSINQAYPTFYQDIYKETVASGFTMASDIMTCSLLRTLASSKPSGKFLELGTGTGLSTSWILDGMDQHATLVSVDHDDKLMSIARKFLGSDQRLTLTCSEGETWIRSHHHQKYDYIFADTWPGKYFLLDDVLAMLRPGGFYIIDDMLPQPNWPDGHHDKVTHLLQYLDSCEDLWVTKQTWASGIVVGVKR